MRCGVVLFFFCLVGLPVWGQGRSWDVELRVDAGAWGASAVRSPFKTLGGGVRAALREVERGNDVILRVAEGVYRESVRLVGGGGGGALAIEGLGEGFVLKGTRYVGGWSLEGSRFRLRVGRGELPRMVFVEGVRLRAVSRLEYVVAGTVFEGGGYLVMLPPPYGRVGGGTVEVSYGAGVGILVENLSHVTLRNVGVRGGYGQGIVLRDVGVANLSHCRVVYNESVGLLAEGVGSLSLENSFITKQAMSGVSLRGVGQLKMRGVQVSLNAWRWVETWNKEGLRRPCAFRSVGGKILAFNFVLHENRSDAVILEGTSAVFERVSIIGNLGRGIWVRGGEQVEPSVEVSEGVIAMQWATGVLNEGGLVSLKALVFYDNGREGKTPQLISQHQTFLDRCIVEAARSRGHLIEVSGRLQGQASHGEKAPYRGRGNLFYQREGKVFLLKDRLNAEGKALSLDLAAWQQRTGQDKDSLFGAPKLENPEKFEFLPSSESPWFRKKNPN